MRSPFSLSSSEAWQLQRPVLSGWLYGLFQSRRGTPHCLVRGFFSRTHIKHFPCGAVNPMGRSLPHSEKLLEKCGGNPVFFPVILLFADGEVLKKILLALLASSLLLLPAAEAAKPARSGKAAVAKQSRAAKPVAKPQRRVDNVRQGGPASNACVTARHPRPGCPDSRRSGAPRGQIHLRPRDRAGGGRTLYAKNIDAVVPIASITKLMTAMVVLDAKLEPARRRRRSPTTTSIC